MPLSHPYLVAFRRSLAAASLVGVIQATMWLIACLALARLIDHRLAGHTLMQVLPWALAIAVAASAAGLLSVTRSTLLNRRRVWLLHALGEKVVEHEVWVAADRRQRSRSLAAVALLGRFGGSTAARALVDTPWALCAIGAIWLVDMDMAVIASSAALLLIVMTIASVHLSPRAQTFDHTVTAHSEGDAAVRAAPVDPDALPEDARSTARNWEATQGAHLATLYDTAQASSRRRIGTATIMGCTALMIGGLILERPVSDGQTPGGLVAILCVIVAALAVLARGAVGAPLTAQARAARNHLLLLRTDRSRHSEPRRKRLAGPDVRAPMAATLALTVAATAALIATALHWDLSLPLLTTSFAHAEPQAKTLDAPRTIAPAARKDKS